MEDLSASYVDNGGSINSYLKALNGDFPEGYEVKAVQALARFHNLNWGIGQCDCDPPGGFDKVYSGRSFLYHTVNFPLHPQLQKETAKLTPGAGFVDRILQRKRETGCMQRLVKYIPKGQRDAYKDDPDKQAREYQRSLLSLAKRMAFFEEDPTFVTHIKSLEAKWQSWMSSENGVQQQKRIFVDRQTFCHGK